MAFGNVSFFFFHRSISRSNVRLVRLQTFYFIGRYCLLASLTGVCVSLYMSIPVLAKNHSVLSRSTSKRAYAFAFHHPSIIYVLIQKDELSIPVYVQSGISH
jgi:hypothetical protein